MNTMYETVSETRYPAKDPIPSHDNFIIQFGDLNVVPNTYIPACDGLEYFMVWPDRFYVYNVAENQWRKVDRDNELIVERMGCPRCKLLNTHIMRGFIRGKTGWVVCTPCGITYHLKTKEIDDD